MGQDECSSRFHYLMAAMGRSGRAVPRQCDGAAVQLDLRRPVSRLGMARAVLAQHRHGRDRTLHPAGHSRDANLHPHRRGEAHRACAGHRGAETAAQTGRVDGPGSDRSTGPVLNLRRLRLHLRYDDVAQFAQPAAGCGDVRHCAVGGHHPACRAPFRPLRPQADVHHWHRINRSFHLRLLRAVKYGHSCRDLRRYYSILHSARYGLWAAGSANRRVLPPRVRYSGSSLGFHLASIIAGGPAPLIATTLLAWTGSGYSVALYVLLSCVISIAATIPLPDYTNRDISEEPVYGPAESTVLAEASPGR